MTDGAKLQTFAIGAAGELLVQYKLLSYQPRQVRGLIVPRRFPWLSGCGDVLTWAFGG
jgi:hypothetical protein